MLFTCAALGISASRPCKITSERRGRQRGPSSAGDVKATLAVWQWKTSTGRQIYLNNCIYTTTWTDADQAIANHMHWFTIHVVVHTNHNRVVTLWQWSLQNCNYTSSTTSNVGVGLILRNWLALYDFLVSSTSSLQHINTEINYKYKTSTGLWASWRLSPKTTVSFSREEFQGTSGTIFSSSRLLPPSLTYTDSISRLVKLEVNIFVFNYLK